MKNNLTRRAAIGKSIMATMAALAGNSMMMAHGAERVLDHSPTRKKLPFRISLNTSTLMAYKLPADQQIEMVAAAGFDGIELWMRDIMAYLEHGGSTQTLRHKLQAGPLVLENIIGFSQWCSDEASERGKAIEQLRKEMGIIAELGGRYIAAPVMGIKTLDRTQYDAYAERYLAILELEKETGVVPVIEIWGAGALNKLSDAAQITIATGHPKATILLDFYHLYRGGSDWDTLDCLNGRRLPVIHMNDYPAQPAREQLTDAHRLLPGEGVCPFDQVLPKLHDSGFRGGLSVELFNKEYWAGMDAPTLLKSSYDSTYKVVEHALGDRL